MPQPDPNVSFHVEEIPDWDPETFRFEKDELGRTLVGSCPKCGHPVDKRFRADGLFTFDERSVDGPDVDQAVMHCNCPAIHEGGESGQGCGRYWGLSIERQ